MMITRKIGGLGTAPARQRRRRRQTDPDQRGRFDSTSSAGILQAIARSYPTESSSRAGGGTRETVRLTAFAPPEIVIAAGGAAHLFQRLDGRGGSRRGRAATLGAGAEADARVDLGGVERTLP